jgi:hypothetical protein
MDDTARHVRAVGSPFPPNERPPPRWIGGARAHEVEPRHDRLGSGERDLRSSDGVAPNAIVHRLEPVPPPMSTNSVTAMRIRTKKHQTGPGGLDATSGRAKTYTSKGRTTTEDHSFRG